MSFYKEVPGRKTTLESTLKFDTEPKAGSTNPVTSEGVKSAIDGAVGDAAAALQQQIDEIAEKAGSGYIPKGEATVATLNGLSGQENGDLYTMTDAGTLTEGSLAVVAGDTVAWDATNEVWYKAMDYAPSQYGTNEVHNLPTTITAFRTGDVIPVDGPSGTAKMSKDDLLKETAENALAGNLAPAFNPLKPNGADGYAYHFGEVVTYQGKTYRFTSDKTSGAWDSTKVTATDLISFPNFQARAGYSLVTNNLIDISFSDISGTNPNRKATIIVNANATLLFDRSYTTLASGTTFSDAPYTYGGLFAIYDIFARTFKRFEVFGIGGSTLNMKSLTPSEIAIPVAKWNSGELIYSCCEYQIGGKNKIKNIFDKGTICYARNNIEISFSGLSGSDPNQKGTLTITSGSTILFNRSSANLATNTTFSDAAYTYGGLFAIVDTTNKNFKEFRVCGIAGSSVNMLSLGYEEYAIPVIMWVSGNPIYTCYDNGLYLDGRMTSIEDSVSDVVDFWNDTTEQELDSVLIRDDTALNTGNTYRTEVGYEFRSLPVEAGGKIHVVGDIDVITRFSFTTSSFYTPSIVSTPFKNETAVNTHFDLELDVPSGASWFQMTLKKGNTYYFATNVAQSTDLVRHHTLYVATTGSDVTGDGSLDKPFATIFAANNSITDASEHNRYTIKVADGTYDDMEARYSGTTPVGYQGIVCKAWVTYEGNVDHPENVVLKWDGSVGYDTFTYSGTAFMKCLFHILGNKVSEGHFAGKQIIRGFKLVAENTRYCIHVETAGYGLGVDWEITDCLFDWNGVPADPAKNNSDPPPVIGTGSGHFEKGLIARCKITNTAPVNKGFLNHDSAYMYDNARFREGAKIFFDSVDFGGGSVRFRTTHGDNNVDGYNRCYVHNCTGISTFDYDLSGGSTDVDWRADVKCSDIVNNVFATNGKLQ